MDDMCCKMLPSFEQCLFAMPLVDEEVWSSTERKAEASESPHDGIRSEARAPNGVTCSESSSIWLAWTYWVSVLPSGWTASWSSSRRQSGAYPRDKMPLTSSSCTWSLWSDHGCVSCCGVSGLWWAHGPRLVVPLGAPIGTAQRRKSRMCGDHCDRWGRSSRCFGRGSGDCHEKCSRFGWGHMVPRRWGEQDQSPWLEEFGTPEPRRTRWKIALDTWHDGSLVRWTVLECVKRTCSGWPAVFWGKTTSCLLWMATTNRKLSETFKKDAWTCSTYCS